MNDTQFTPGQLVELHQRNSPGAKSPILRTDLAEFMRNPTLWCFIEEGLQPEMLQEWTKEAYKKLGLGSFGIPSLPRTFTPRQAKLLAVFGFRIFYIPSMNHWEYPERPHWLRVSSEVASFQVDFSKRQRLENRWVAIETIAKPNESNLDGYPDDRLGMALSLETRLDRSDSAKGRTFISWDWLYEAGIYEDKIRSHDRLREKGLLSKVAQILGFPKNKGNVQLPKVEEWYFFANLFRDLRLRLKDLQPYREGPWPDLGTTNLFEWCKNLYEPDCALAIGGTHMLDDRSTLHIEKQSRCSENRLTGFRVLVNL